MDLNPTPQDESFRLQVRQWLADNLPKKKLETIEERKEWHRKLYEAGYLGMGWPKEYGGQNARPMEQAIVGAEMARVNAPAAVNGLGIGIVGPTIIHHGTEAQKQRYIRNILTAEEIWCQLYSEPNAGSDLAGLRTRAELDGDDYVVNGQKIWTSGGMNADWGILLARTDQEAPKHQGISCFLLDMHAPGVEVRPIKQISGSSEFCEVFFTNVRVPAENLVGELNRGWQIAQTTLSYERGGNTLSRVSRQTAQFDRLLEVAKTLKRNGRPAIEDPIIRQQLGQMYAEIEVLRYATLRLLSRLEKGLRPGPDSSISKLYYSELDKRLQEMTQAILGPYGQLTEGLSPDLSLDGGEGEGDGGTWAHSFVWSRAGTIYAGSNEIQKNIIGERVLGLPKEVRADRIALKAGAR
ncbi:MAG: acyl-CoA dehydrogenase family protein [Thermomicrobiales bacterium]